MGIISSKTGTIWATATPTNHNENLHNDIDIHFRSIDNNRSLNSSLNSSLNEQLNGPLIRPLKRFNISPESKMILAHELLKVNMHNNKVAIVKQKTQNHLNQQVLDTLNETIRDLQQQNKMLSDSLDMYKRLYHEATSKTSDACDN